MGEEFEGTQVSCRVGAKIGTRSCGNGQRLDEWLIRSSPVYHFFYPPSSFLGYPLCCSCCTLVSFPSFRSLDNRLALFFILFLPFVLLSSSTVFLTNLLTLYDNAHHPIRSQIAFICKLIHLVHVPGLLWKTNEF